MAAFIFQLFVPIIMYVQLMSQMFFPVTLAIIEGTSNKKYTQTEVNSKDLDFSTYTYSWVVVFIFFLLMGVTMIKNLKVFITMNTYGVFFTIIIILYLCGYGIIGISKGDYEFISYLDNKTTPLVQSTVPGSPTKILLFGTNYGPLMGILGGGFYLHNISLPVYKNSRNPEKNVRDMFLGFFCVLMSYVLSGTLGMFAFTQKKLWGYTTDDNIK